MKLPQSSSLVRINGSLVKLATLVVLTLLLLTTAVPHLPMVSASVPSGGDQKSSSDVLLFCGSSWRKLFLGKDYGCSGSESVSTSSSSRRKLPSLSLKAGKASPYPPSPTKNQRTGMGYYAPPPLTLKL